MKEDKGLAPGLKQHTFREMSEILEKLLTKEAIETPQEMAFLEHFLVLIEWYLRDDQAEKDRLRDCPYKVSEEILGWMGFAPEEVIAINVFFRKKKPALEELKEAIKAKIERLKKPKEGVKISAGS